MKKRNSITLRSIVGFVIFNTCLAFGADIFFLDQSGSSQRLLKINPTTGAQSVLATGGSLGSFFNGQGDTAVDGAGRILVTFQGGATGIVRVDPASGAQTVVSSGGLFQTPSSICVGTDGSIYFLDQNGTSQRLLKVNPNTGAQSILASGGSLGTFFNGQGDLAVDSVGRILVTFQGGATGTVRVDPTSGAQTVISSGGLFQTPSSICVGTDGSIYFLDQNGSSQRLLKVNPTTGAQSILASGGSLGTFWNGQGDLAVDAAGRILVTFGSGGGNGVVRVDPTSGAQTIVSSGGLLQNPSSICFGKEPLNVSIGSIFSHTATGLVDVYYALAASGSGSSTVSLQVSTDGGATYFSPSAGALSGDVGAGIDLGSRKLTWDAAQTFPASFSGNNVKSIFDS